MVPSDRVSHPQTDGFTLRRSAKCILLVVCKAWLGLKAQAWVQLRGLRLQEHLKPSLDLGLRLGLALAWPEPRL